MHGPRGHARHCMLGSPAPQAQLVRRTMRRRLPEWLLRVWDEEVHVPCVRSFARARLRRRLRQSWRALLSLCSARCGADKRAACANHAAGASPAPTAASTCAQPPTAASMGGACSPPQFVRPTGVCCVHVSAAERATLRAERAVHLQLRREVSGLEPPCRGRCLRLPAAVDWTQLQSQPVPRRKPDVQRAWALRGDRRRAWLALWLRDRVLGDTVRSNVRGLWLPSDELSVRVQRRGHGRSLTLLPARGRVRRTALHAARCTPRGLPAVPWHACAAAPVRVACASHRDPCARTA